MSLAPFFAADPVIQIHALAASVSLLLGPLALYSRKRGRLHKIAGYIWVGAMSLSALSSFFIFGFELIGPFSPLHLLSLYLLYGIFEAMRHVIAGRVAVHAFIMRRLYWYGVVLASAFNFLPGRMVNRIFFNDLRDAGFVVLAAVLAGVIARAYRLRRDGRAVAA